MKKTNFNYRLGERLAELREAHGWTQEQAAAFYGCSRETVSRWENASRDINAEKAADLAEIYNISADTLLGLNGGKTLYIIEWKNDGRWSEYAKRAELDEVVSDLLWLGENGYKPRRVRVREEVKREYE